MRSLTPILFVLLILTAIIAASCSVGVESRPVNAPMQMPTQPTAEEKVVSMATLTTMPTFDPNVLPATPTPLAPGESLPGPTPTPVNPPVRQSPTPLSRTDVLEGTGIPVGMIADPTAGIQLSFPEGWSILPVDEATKANASMYMMQISSPPEAVPSGVPMVLALTVQKGSYTYEEAVKLRLAEYQNPGWAILSDEPLTLPSGEPANIWRLDTPEGRIAQMVTVIDGNIILLTGMGDLFLFDPIAASLQRLTASKPGG